MNLVAAVEAPVAALGAAAAACPAAANSCASSALATLSCQYLPANCAVCAAVFAAFVPNPAVKPDSNALEPEPPVCAYVAKPAPNTCC
jgi:hypothetical protein